MHFEKLTGPDFCMSAGAKCKKKNVGSVKMRARGKVHYLRPPGFVSGCGAVAGGWKWFVRGSWKFWMTSVFFFDL